MGGKNRIVDCAYMPSDIRVFKSPCPTLQMRRIKPGDGEGFVPVTRQISEQSEFGTLVSSVQYPYTSPAACQPW